MDIFEMSFNASLLILAILLARLMFINRIPHKVFNALWIVCGVRLMIPLSIPSRFSIFNIIKGLTSTPNNMYNSSISVAEQGTHYTPSINYMVIIWMVGFIIMTGYFVRSYIISIREVSCSLPDNRVNPTSLLEKFNFIRNIEIRQSDLIATPLTYGIVKPVIVLPKNMVSVNEEQLEYILLHEIVHIKRLDTLKKILLSVILCVHWFNPLVWLMMIIANRDIEIFCDYQVLNMLGSSKKAQYAHSLIKFEENKLNYSPVCMFNKSSIKERIKSIMKYSKPTKIGICANILLFVSIIFIFATSVDYSENNQMSKSDRYILKKKAVEKTIKAQENSLWNAINSIDINDEELEEHTVRVSEAVEGLINEEHNNKSITKEE